MYSLTKAANIFNSTTPVQCITKSLHVLSNITTQVDLTKRRSTLLSLNESLDQENAVGKVSSRNSSYFSVHPEKLKQIIKEKDGQTLCRFFDSQDYKNRVIHTSEQQKQISYGNPAGVKQDNVYRHVLSCAQPVRKKRGYTVDTPQLEQSESTFKYEETVPQKITIMSAILRQKSAEEGDVTYAPQQKAPMILPIFKKPRVEVKMEKKKVKRVTTIMPIFLKKIKQNLEKRRQMEEHIEARSTFGETAKKIKDVENIDFANQVLNFRDQKINADLQAGTEDTEALRRDDVFEKSLEKENKIIIKRRERRRKEAIFYPDLKLADYSTNYTFPASQKQWPPRKRKYPFSSGIKPKDNELKEPPGFTEIDLEGTEENLPNEKSVTLSSEPSPQSQQFSSEISGELQNDMPTQSINEYIKVAKKTPARKQWSYLSKKLKPIKQFKKTESLSESCEENLPAATIYKLESAVDPAYLNKASKRNVSTYILRDRPSQNKLFEKVKSGNKCSINKQ